MTFLGNNWPGAAKMETKTANPPSQAKATGLYLSLWEPAIGICKFLETPVKSVWLQEKHRERLPNRTRESLLIRRRLLQSDRVLFILV